MSRQKENIVLAPKCIKCKNTSCSHKKIGSFDEVFKDDKRNDLVYCPNYK